MVSVPDLEPGDYVIWHPDVVHAVDGVSSYFPMTAPTAAPQLPARTHSRPRRTSLSTRLRIIPPIRAPHRTSPPSRRPARPDQVPAPGPYPASTSAAAAAAADSHLSPPRHRTPTATATCTVTVTATAGAAPAAASARTRSCTVPIPGTRRRPTRRSSTSPACPPDADERALPRAPAACVPARSRAPDFSEAGNGSSGERDHAGRSGVQDVADAGGEDGLRSMGLTPFEEFGSRRNNNSGGNSNREREREKDIRAYKAREWDPLPGSL
ncbi:hypothetical protein CIB48_g317 [Xylaria polymorpha]|nr:hypothetical protein CIB48_g317 [Xylaria polymorpha]